MTQTDFKLTLKDSLNTLINSKKESFEFLNHGSLSVKLYKPDKTDTQDIHMRDEIYVIANGSGEFIYEEERTNFHKDDIFFVPKGTHHRFENFSDDFVTWVFFYGY